MLADARVLHPRDGMPVVGILPALSIIAGALCAPILGTTAGWLLWLLPALLIASVIAWRYSVSRATVACLTLGFWVSSVVLTSSALDRARHPALRQFLEREFGGFEISTLGPEAVHDPILARAVLIEDASPREGYVSLHVEITALRLKDAWHPVEGGVIVSVGGAAPSSSRSNASARDQPSCPSPRSQSASSASQRSRVGRRRVMSAP